MKRYVITGGASCGKTTIIAELWKRGHRVLEETAWEVIEDRLENKVTPEEITKRQLLIFQRQLRRENYDFGNHPVFQDRSLADWIAYSKILLPKTPKQIAEFNFRNRYDAVFIPDTLPIELNPVRVETSDREIQRVHQELFKAYQEQGYTPIRIPTIPIHDPIEAVKQRTDFILDYLNLPKQT